MRYSCWFCGKSVTSEVPNDSVIRALLVCPECIEAGEVIIPDKGAGARVSRTIHVKTPREPS